MSMFRKATKSTSRLRMALVGPSGSGKTYSALAIATGLTAPTNGRIAVIDTEHGSASLYSDQFVFEVVELAQFDPRNYIEMIQAAEHEGYSVIVIDSLSHAWSGKGGALELVDNAAKRSRSNNTFTAWRDITPLHNALVDAIIGSRCHVIATMRTKVDYAMEADPVTGKMAPKKIGMAPIQREGMDYEFTIVGDMDLEHNLLIGKTRCAMLDRAVINRPGAALARQLLGWLNDGGSATASASTSAPTLQTARAPSPAVGGHPVGASEAAPPAITTAGSLDPEMSARLTDLIARTKMREQQVRSALAKRGVSDINRLAPQDAADMIRNLETILSRMEWDPLGDKGKQAEEPNVGGSNSAEGVVEPRNEDTSIVAETKSDTATSSEPTTEPAADPPAETSPDTPESDPAADDYVVPSTTRRAETKRGSKAAKAATTSQPLTSNP